MKTYTRFGLMLLVTVILLLALTVPAMAKKEEPYQCFYRPVMVSPLGTYNIFGSESRATIYGENEAEWEEGTLYNTCTGKIDFGAESFGEWKYANLDQTCEFLDYRVNCDGNGLYSDQTIWPLDRIEIYDPDTEDLLHADAWSFTLDDNGDFVFSKEYTP